MEGRTKRAGEGGGGDEKKEMESKLFILLDRLGKKIHAAI